MKILYLLLLPFILIYDLLKDNKKSILKWIFVFSPYMLMSLAIIFEEKVVFVSLSFILLLSLVIMEEFKNGEFNFYMINILISACLLVIAVFIDIIISPKVKYRNIPFKTNTLSYHNKVYKKGECIDAYLSVPINNTKLFKIVEPKVKCVKDNIINESIELLVYSNKPKITKHIDILDKDIEITYTKNNDKNDTYTLYKINILGIK